MSSIQSAPATIPPTSEATFNRCLRTPNLRNTRALSCYGTLT